MAEFELSAFADEYSPALDEQIEGLRKNGIGCLEIRGVDGKNIADLTLDEAKLAKVKLDAGGIKVSSIGSPIGKIGINDDMDAHIERLKHVIELADVFDTRLIRMFSFFIPKGEAPSEYRGEVMERLGRMLKVADESGVLLCHENEKGIYGDNAERCLDIQQEFGGAIRCVFDHCNFLQCGVEPYPYAFELLKDYIYYIHIKDATEELVIVPAGKGVGRIPETMAELARRDRHYYVTVEPHLKVFGGLAQLEGANELSKIGGAYATNIEAFDAAVGAIKKIISNIK